MVAVNRTHVSKYRAMWVFVMFDLPVETATERKRSAKFRHDLLIEGFVMLQYSVYARYCDTQDKLRAVKKYIRSRIPPDGQVRILGVTDTQFGNSEVYFGKTRKPPECPPEQLVLF